MKIVFVGLEYDRYDEKRGRSFEYNNFYGALKALPGVDVSFYSFQSILTIGKKEWNEELLRNVKATKPDLIFFFMYTDELLPETLDALKKETTTLAWFSDDHWRFDNYSRHYVNHFTWVATTYSKAPERYRALGQVNVIRSQWFCDVTTYKPYDVPADIDVSFVGLKNESRGKLIMALQAAGIPVSVFGGGWGGGRLPQEDMVRLFSRSHINLNISTPRSPWEKNSLGRLVARRSRDRFVPDFHIVDNVRSWFGARTAQIKARPFEISACGGFCLTGDADDMGTYYEDGKEMVFYRSIPDLIKKINYYLAHDDERRAIARAGYARTLREHTAEKRFNEMFRVMGLGAL